MKIMEMSLLAGLLSACGFVVDDAEAIRAAEALGMRDVEVVGRHELAHGFLGCSRDDAIAVEVLATNPAGRRVEAVVCCGWPFKGCTVRSK